MNITRLAGALVAGAALAVPAVALSAPDAHARHGGASAVRVAGTCTASTHAKLKAKADDGRVEVEFEVDANRKGQRWSVAITDNGEKVWSGTRVTKGRSGSFSVEKRTANRAGVDVISATATNARSGETCTATLTYSR